MSSCQCVVPAPSHQPVSSKCLVLIGLQVIAPFSPIQMFLFFSLSLQIFSKLLVANVIKSHFWRPWYFWSSLLSTLCLSEDPTLRRVCIIGKCYFCHIEKLRKFSVVCHPPFKVSLATFGRDALYHYHVLVFLWCLTSAVAQSSTLLYLCEVYPLPVHHPPLNMYNRDSVLLTC